MNKLIINNFFRKHWKVLILLILVFSILFMYSSSFNSNIDSKNKTQAQRCRNFITLNDTERDDCFKTFGHEVVALMSSESAFEAIKYLYDKDPEAMDGRCHSMMHTYGDIVYSEIESGLSIEDVKLTEESIIMCMAGFLHGFLEHYIKTDDSNPISGICRSISNKYPQSEAYILNNCYHGIGHGYMIEPQEGSPQWGNDIAIVDYAVKRCNETFSADESEKEVCYSGIFNTIALWKKYKSFGLKLEHDEPFKLCEAQRNKSAEIKCYEMEVMMLLSENDNWELESFLKEYGHVIDNDFKKQDIVNTFIPMQIQSMIVNGEGDPPKFLSICRVLDNDLSLYCIKAVVDGIWDFGAILGEEYYLALNFCKLSELSQEEKYICYTKINSRMNLTYSNEKKISACSQFENEYQKICKI